MAKAARQLAVSQPAVSEAIASLEHILNVRLLDRNPRGIEPTIYADAILKRSETVFDELKQGVRDIACLADPSTGEVRIACSETISATVLPFIIERFSEKHPRTVLHVDTVDTFEGQLPVLRNRQFDLVLSRWRPPLRGVSDDLNVEDLFDDPLVVAAGMRSGWARRRKIDLAELANEPWIMQAPHTWNYSRLAEAFQARGLAIPKASLVTHSMPLVVHFVATGRFIAAYPRSVARFNSLKVLPVDLPDRAWPVSIMTLKNRTLSPVVERFIECAREVSKFDCLRAGCSQALNPTNAVSPSTAPLTARPRRTR
jgi:DNA-binding transcriptional LysR family regulator